MGKCIMTKLKESVSDNNLLKIGELRIEVKSEEAPTVESRGFRIKSLKDQLISIISDEGYFTNSSLTSNLGKTMRLNAEQSYVVYVSNSDCIISIENKYALVNLNFTVNNNVSHSHFTFDIEELDGCNELINLILNNTSCFGDIKNLAKCTKLQILNFASLNITGDIEALKDCTMLTTVQLNDTNVEGDIKVFENCVNITQLVLTNTNLCGNLSSLSNLINAVRFLLSNTYITGSTNSLSTCTNLEYIELKKLAVTGDLSLLPSKIYFISNQSGTGVFTWENTRVVGSRIVAMEKINLGQYIDAMLINQANCSAYNAGSDSYLKNINASGTRTSASDNAATTLNTKGYTVTIS